MNSSLSLRENKKQNRGEIRYSYENLQKMSPEPIPLPIKIVHIDNPKTQLILKTKKSKVLPFPRKSLILPRSKTSDLPRQARKKTKINISLEKSMYQKQTQDEKDFSDKNMLGDQSKPVKRITKEMKEKILKVIEEAHESPSIIKEEKQSEKDSQQKMNRYKKQEKSEVKLREKPKRKIFTKRERRVNLPEIKGNPITSHSYRRRYNGPHLYNLEEKDGLEGWALNSAYDDNEKKIDIIQYTKNSLGMQKKGLHSQKI